MSQLSRRSLLKASAAASALAIPYFVPARSFGANDRILTGHIGVGNQGKGNLGAFLSNAVAVCDVDSERAAAAAKTVEEKNGACEVFGDYRQLLDRKDIDAVVITTPDHWHALPTIEACQAGKDVYVEKPLSLTIVEGRKMVAAARANKRIVQTGSQQRSDAKFRRACELVRSGRLGKLQTVLVGIPGPNNPAEMPPDGDPPPELDYDFWLGPAPQRPYNEKRVHYNFRFWWDYSGGQITNFGAHHLDIAQWALGMDDSGPVAVDGTATFNANKLHEVTETCRIEYRYASGVKLILGQKQKDIPDGVTFIGEQGEIAVTRGSLKVKPEELANAEPAAGDVQLYNSSNHHRNFLDCIKSRELPICDVEIGHRSATVCHLGNIVARLGRGIQWDPEKEEIVGDADAAQWVERPYRQPWKLG